MLWPQDDIILGRKLATGGFGTVFRADLKEGDGTTTPVILKKVRRGAVKRRAGCGAAQCGAVCGCAAGPA